MTIIYRRHEILHGLTSVPLTLLKGRQGPEPRAVGAEQARQVEGVQGGMGWGCCLPSKRAECGVELSSSGWYRAGGVMGNGSSWNFHRRLGVGL